MYRECCIPMAQRQGEHSTSWMDKQLLYDTFLPRDPSQVEHKKWSSAMRSSGPCFDTRHVSHIWMCRSAFKKTSAASDSYQIRCYSMSSIFATFLVCFPGNLGLSCHSSFLVGPKLEISLSFWPCQIC